jgi:ParB-like chromosome segregation protein Spo0J
MSTNHAVSGGSGIEEPLRLSQKLRRAAIGEINARRNGANIMVWKRKAGFGRKLKRVRTNDKVCSKLGGEHSLHAIETKDIKIKDLIVGKRFRQPRDEDVAKLAESLKKLGQPRAITVRRPRFGKYPLIAGATLVAALKALHQTIVRADIVKCTNAQARQWEVAENLYRASLTPLDEADHIAEWVRLVAESSSGKGLSKSKRGRPEGALTKVARDLPIKGNTQQARRKRLERGLKIAALSSEGRSAATEVGLDKNRDALYEIAKEDTPEAQINKAREISRGKSKAKFSARGLGKTRRKKSKTFGSKAALPWKHRRVLDKLIAAWNDADELKAMFAEAAPGVRARFIELLRCMRAGKGDLEISARDDSDDQSEASDRNGSDDEEDKAPSPDNQDDELDDEDDTDDQKDWAA